MIAGKIPFTHAAYLKMQQRVDTLTTELKAVMDRLKDAREMGDLSENGAYKYAKFEIGNIKRELRTLRDLLDQGFVAEPTTGTIIGFGSVVHITSSGGAVKEFQLVSKYESNPVEKKLSMDSPLGMALMGKCIGETVIMTTPTGEARYHIDAIE